MSIEIIGRVRSSTITIKLPIALSLENQQKVREQFTGSEKSAILVTTFPNNGREIHFLVRRNFQSYTIMATFAKRFKELAEGKKVTPDDADNTE